VIAEHFTRRWQRAGLIDEALAHRIVAWESSHRRPVALWAIAGMGALAVLLGTMAVIGANWEDIPAWLKLAVDLALNALAAAAVFVFWQRGHMWLRELAALFLFGLVLSGIALIGQVYQLQSPTWQALVLWLVLCTPFLALTAFTRLNGALWAVAVVTTWFAAESPIGDLLTGLGMLQRTGDYLLLPMGYIIACLMIVVSAVRGLWAPAESQARLLLKLSLAALIAACSLAISFGERHVAYAGLGPIALAAITTLPAALALWKSRLDIEPWIRVAFLVGSFVVWAIGFRLFARDDMTADILRAVLFILYWAAIGAIAARAGWRGWFGFAFTVIGVRLLILYFEAIGGLTATGLGLIGGGVLCLALTALGWRLTRDVRRPRSGAAA